MNTDELIKAVQDWSIARGLDNASSTAQTVKLMEEVGELARAVLNGDRDGIIDSIGDATVVLIILAQQNELEFSECLNAAWDQIKNRTGKTQNGVFIKDKK